MNRIAIHAHAGNLGYCLAGKLPTSITGSAIKVCRSKWIKPQLLEVFVPIATLKD